MPMTSASLPVQSKLSALAAHTGGALAVGAGLVAPFSAFAAPVNNNTQVVRDINITITSGNAHPDLNGDGTPDMTFDVANSTNVYGFVKGWGSIDFLEVNANGSSFVARLGAGAIVNQLSADGSATTWNNYGALYSNASGPWADVGAHGYMGLRFRAPDGSYNYGWLEVTRGSLILGQAGYQTIAGVAAVTPVPEPSSLMLMACGAAGVLALRRRRQQQAGAQPVAH